jgi:hypothetical protein
VRILQAAWNAFTTHKVSYHWATIYHTRIMTTG